MIRALSPLPFALVLAHALALAGCGEEPAAKTGGDPLAADPLLAAALHDPLMTDPDLSHRNEANAVLTVPASHALPPLRRSEEAAQAAREAARLELLEGGRIPELPRAGAAKGPDGFAGAPTASAMLAAAGAPGRCTRGLEAGFAFAADLPAMARIMPHGMVRAAAGGTACGARAVRYLTPAAGEDVLQYHFTRAARAGTAPRLHDAPVRMVAASGEGGAMLVAVGAGPGALTAVDLVWWRP